FRSCLRETIAWTASTEQGSICHTACITAFSNSASGGRMTAREVDAFVMVQLVPQAESVAKRFLHGFTGPYVHEPNSPIGLTDEPARRQHGHLNFRSLAPVTLRIHPSGRQILPGA